MISVMCGNCRVDVSAIAAQRFGLVQGQKITMPQFDAVMLANKAADMLNEADRILEKEKAGE